MEATIEVTGLRKRFGRAQALDGMTFTVNPGASHRLSSARTARGKSTHPCASSAASTPPDEGAALVNGKALPAAEAPVQPASARCSTRPPLAPSRRRRATHLLWLAHSQGLPRPAG